MLGVKASREIPGPSALKDELNHSLKREGREMITQQKQWRVDKSLTLPRATPQSRRLRVQEVLSVVVKGSETHVV